MMAAMSRNPNIVPIVVVSAVVIGAVAIYAYEHSQHESTATPLTEVTMSPTSQPSISYGPTPVYEAPAAKCHMRGVLPDANCTPGATDPHVTQSNIAFTICKSGYTATVRPASSYTNKLKREQMSEYGFTDNIRTHEEDHLISLELGGSPADPRNLWPEPHRSPNDKDKVENYLHAAVCAGRISLHAAQVRIATNWTTAEAGVPAS